MTSVIIRDKNKSFCEAATSAGFANVECEELASKKAGCVVLPANSFGIMGAGCALYLAERFPEVQESVFDVVRAHGGELLVGQAAAVSTDDDDIPFMIAAPTMRVPQTITNPIDIYLSTRAAMREWLFIVSNIEELGAQSIVFPGMGTGKGNVDFAVAARAMKVGIDHAIGGAPMPDSKEKMFKYSDELYKRIRHGV